MSTTEESAEQLFESLCKAIRGEHLHGNVPDQDRIRFSIEWQMRVTAHVRAKTGHNTLPNYHNNGASEAEKIALYQECLAAVMNQDCSKLLGGVANGQAAAPVQPGETTVVSKPDEPRTRRTVRKTVAPTAAENTDELRTALTILGKHLGGGNTEISPELVRAIAEEVFAQQANDRFVALAKDLRHEIKEAFEQLGRNILANCERFQP